MRKARLLESAKLLLLFFSAMQQPKRLSDRNVDGSSYLLPPTDSTLADAAIFLMLPCKQHFCTESLNVAKRRYQTPV